ncbi:uncharacterized protein LOC115221682 isoform X2 [Octopus sinensis]|uniref:Uncharacterized protein LOC115221682 isoform X2 n=1 Tax=Octopus sinensis TaxID=2607531 RepID=A0A6P7TDW4_9MOLL|nr:uncharacterized protein LOC115221682 isoform X2 [Octopus sinensis]
MNFLLAISVPLTTFLLLFNVPVVKSQAVTFSISSSAKIGDSAQFFCNATTTVLQYNAIFIHNDNQIAKAFTPVVSRPSSPNTSVTGSGNRYYYKYTISSLSCSDRGNYKCEVANENAAALKSNSETLDVLGPAGTPNLTAPSDNQILNDNVTVSCESNVGSPAQELHLCVGNTCAKPNPPVKQVDQCIFTQTASLTFQVTKTTKTATCRVGSSSLEDKQTWEVDYPVDAIRLIPDVTEWRLVRGTKTTFECVALGNPDPTTMWEFFPETSQTSRISWGRTMELDPDTSGVYVCTANNTVGGISYNLTKTLTVTVYVPTTTVPPSTTKEPSTTPSTTTKKAGAPAAASTDKNKIIIGSIVPILIIIIIVIIVIILYKRRAKPTEIEEPPEKPRNNHSEVNMMNTKPDLVHSTGMEKKVPMYNNGFDHGGEDDLSSMEVTFDDKPRSRKPVIPISSSDTYNTTLPCV